MIKVKGTRRFSPAASLWGLRPLNPILVNVWDLKENQVWDLKENQVWDLHP